MPERRTPRFLPLLAVVSLLLLSSAALAAAWQGLDPSILADPARSDDDRYRDQGFKPLQVYEFFGVQPGLRVGDLWPARGYNTHILARAVAPESEVVAILRPYERDPEQTAEATEAFAERMAAAGIDNVEIVGELADLPDDSLDILITVRNYHDLGDREARVAAIPDLLRVLAPGGILGVVDAHTDKTGERDESVHRINADLAREEITAGGFEFVAASDLLHNPDDTYDFDGRERAGVRGATEDAPIHRYFIHRWVHKYRKPAR